VLFETMSNSKVANLRCDFGGEYHSKTLIIWLWRKGIDTKLTVAYHSQTNAIAERTNRVRYKAISGRMVGIEEARCLNK